MKDALVKIYNRVLISGPKKEDCIIGWKKRGGKEY